MQTVKEVAFSLNVSPKTIYSWAESGYIPAYKVGDLWRFKPTEIDEWLRKCKNKPTDVAKVAGQMLKAPFKPDVDAILDRTIAQEHGMVYLSSGNGKTDQIRDRNHKKGGKHELN